MYEGEILNQITQKRPRNQEGKFNNISVINEEQNSGDDQSIATDILTSLDKRKTQNTDRESSVEFGTQ